MRSPSVPISLFLIALSLAAPGVPGADPEKTTVSEPVTSWLLTPAHAERLPAFASSETLGVKPDALLSSFTPDTTRLVIAEGRAVTFADGQRRAFEASETEDGRLNIAEESASSPELVLAAAYLHAHRFEKPKLVIETEGLVRVLLDGEQIAERKTAPKSDGDDDEIAKARRLETELVLTTGKHLLLVVLVRDESLPSWTLAAHLEREKKIAKTPLETTIDPERPLGLDDLLGGRAIADLDLSADGGLVAIRLRDPDSTSAERDGWFEIRRTSDGALVRSLRGDDVYSSFAWAPRGRRFSYVTRRGEISTLWTADLDEGSASPVVRGLEKLGSHAWAPDGRSVIYSVSTPYERSANEKAGAVRLRSLPDRWRGFRDVSHLWQANLVDGSRRRLTAGEFETNFLDIRHDSSRLLFSTRENPLDTRPYSTTRIFELDLESLEPREVVSGPWIGAAHYGPDGTSMVVVGGPNAFGDIGRQVEEDRIANDYDGQAYIVDVASGDARAITRDLDPSIEEAAWSAFDGKIYLRTENESRVEILRLDPDTEEFETLPTDVEVVSGFRLARDAARLVYHGTSATEPARAFALDLADPDAGSVPIAYPDEARFRQIQMGEVEDLDFVSSDGTTIRGRVHYPPDLDRKKRYPAIVYYYGGTSPTSRSFGGRYPKNLWAANGYVVYVLQPSGATGFGQEFSSRHVNNWGKTVVPEILEGLDAFLAANRFVDPKRVGCIGASYGGFMTMLLITHTDRFRAAVSHAGISSIASYWGEGWWGYLYSAVATAESFPWNRPDVYIDQSALFRADKVSTPLLLLHGTSDTNVPPGESEQMYTALRVLQKPVEYVRFEGEDHWILQHEKRVIWVNTILAWFDRELKGQPEHWEHLYGK